MKRIVKRVEFPEKTAPKMLRVAAYARVSSGKDAMLHSLSAQVSYYNDLIQKHEGWLFCGVFADEATTGTKDSRENYQKLLEECRKGAIDLVLTKSISRFARNTVTLLETVRELKSLGVDVYFEEQNIHSISPDGELMLTVLASYAQEESRSASENRKWQIRKDFEQGKVGSITILGYRRTADGSLEVVPEEAEIVKMIFSDYLSGMGRGAIAKKLNRLGIPSRRRNGWCASGLMRVLTNEKYVGDMLLQKYYRENYITKKKMVNHGELPRYLVQDSHEPIISREMFDAVQAEMKRRQKYNPGTGNATRYPFSGKILCGCCGKNYQRKSYAKGSSWLCGTYIRKGKEFCPESKMIPETVLYQACCEVLETETFNAEKFGAEIERIEVPQPNEMVFIFNDGHTVEYTWKDHSRSESWTDEMKERARERSKKK